MKSRLTVPVRRWPVSGLQLQGWTPGPVRATARFAAGVVAAAGYS